MVADMTLVGINALKSRDPYHQALVALTDFASEGRFGWGQPLVATSLAGELRLSPTPIREALARLAGEGLIEHRPGRGYFALSPTASDIVDLYEMHRRLAHWAIDLTPERFDLPPSESELLTPVEAFYGRLVSGVRNDVLAKAYRRTVLQLRPVRQVETQIGPDGDYYVAQQQRLLSEGRFDALRQAVDVYHHDRAASAPSVLSVMRRAAQSIESI